MRVYITTALCTLVVLIGLIGYQQKFWQDASLPFDDEQEGLNDQIVLNFSHVVAEDTPKGQAASKFAELLEQKSNGRIRVVIYPNGLLYSDDEEFDALQNGDIQMIAPTVSKLTNLFPTFQVLDLPFLFETDEEVERILTGPLGELLLNQLSRLEMKGLAFWNNGFKQLLSEDELILNREDFKGLKVRAMPSKVLQMQFTLLEATPITASFDEIYSELENGLIDTQENTVSNLYSKGFYKLHKNLTISNHGILSYAVILNEDFYNSLPSDLQDAVVEAMNEATEWNFNHSKQMNEANLISLQALEGVHIENLSPEEKEKWKILFEPIYTYYRDEVSSNFLEEIQNELLKE